jgi:serine/threonine protein phosphatase PrpC
MRFQLLDSLSLPGVADKPNEDSFAEAPHLAVVFDGATPLSEPLLPGPSDAQWIARFAARRLAAHSGDGKGDLRDWLRAAAGDAEKSFAALRRRAPKEPYEIPFSSMMAAALFNDTLEAMWFGDCGLLLRRPSAPEVQWVGEALARRDAERKRARHASSVTAQGPASSAVRTEYLPSLRAARNTVNTRKGNWLFSPDAACADHAASAQLPIEPDSLMLLATDGFLSLVTEYSAHDAAHLLAAAESHGLGVLGEELRLIEAGDPEGHEFPRFKKSDDATALLLRIIA